MHLANNRLKHVIKNQYVETSDRLKNMFDILEKPDFRRILYVWTVLNTVWRFSQTLNVGKNCTNLMQK